MASALRIDRALVSGLGLAMGALAIVAPLEVAVTFMIALVVLPLKRERKLAFLLGAVAIAVGGFRAARAETAFLEARARAPAGSRRCEGVAVVDSSPVREHGAYRWTGLFDAQSCDGNDLPAARSRVAFYSEEGGFARGDEARVIAQIAPPEEMWNDETGDPRPAEARRDVLYSGGVVAVHVLARGHGVAAWIDRARAHARRRIDASFDPDIDPMARALVLGESDLESDDDQAFRASGLAHLLAVSGAHLVIVVAGFVAFVRALLVRIPALASRIDVSRVAALPGVAGSFIYADFAGGSGSAWRAAWMLSFALAARALGRRADGPRAFALSLVMMLGLDPLATFDVSFVLSAAATAGLFLFSANAAAWIGSILPALGPKFARAVSASLGASVACSPILARIAPSLPAGGLVANLLAVPVGELVALPLCLLHALLSPSPSAERGCAIVASGGLRIVLALARYFSRSAYPVPLVTSWQLAALAVGVVAIAVLRGARRVLVVACAALVFAGGEIAAARSGSPRGELRVSFLDVGQGDSAIVDFPDGTTMLVDAGGLVGSPVDVGRRVIAPVLRARRKRKIDVVVLSHPHPDHFGGFATGLDGIAIGEVWDTGQGEREGVSGAYAELFARMRLEGVPIRRPGDLCGTQRVGEARVVVLAPCPAYDPDEGPNDNSLVVKIEWGHRSILFVGDAEAHEESELLRSGGLRADVLKVGHHGSRTSSSAAFIAATAPVEAVISVGSRNHFGHPSAHTLDTLLHAGTRIWRTDRNGEVRIETDGENLTVSSAK